MTSQKERWYQHAVFYELYVRAFRDSNGDGHGDLQGVIEKLDYLREFGVNCIWLLPIYPSPLKDDGYDIADYYNIHPDYGTLDDFDALIQEAHRRDIRIIVDLVINHTSDQHPWFIDARSSIESSKRDWYVWSDSADKYKDARIIFLDVETSNWAYDHNTDQYYWHRFYSTQPDLNFDNPEVREAMLDVMKFWLERGVDGFRVDAVPYLYEREGTNCENLAETHFFVKEMRRYIETHWPDAILLAEANQFPADVFSYFGTGDEFHMAFNFPLMPRVFLALHFQQANIIQELWHRIPPIPDSCQWCTFLRNHDELSLEMVTEGERHLLWNVYAPEKEMRLNLGIRRRLFPLMGDSLDKIILANSILLSLPGTPIMYYGDEIGMGDDLGLPDRNGLRTPMQWNDQPNAGFSEAPTDKLYAPAIDRGVSSYHICNVEFQQQDPDSLFHRTRRLIMLHKRYPLLARGSIHFLELANPAVLGLIRSYNDQTFIILHNLSNTDQFVSIPEATFMGHTPINVMGVLGEEYLPIGEPGLELNLTAYHSVWLLLQST